MILNHHTLRRWLAEVHSSLDNARLIECFTQVKDVLQMGFADVRRGLWSLEVSADSSLPHVLLRRNYERRSKNSAGLFESANGRRFVSAELDPHNRILQLLLDDGRCFHVELFGSINVFLVGTVGVIESSFKDPRRWSGQPYVRKDLQKATTDGEDTKPDTMAAIKERLLEGAFHFNKFLTMEFLHSVVDANNVEEAKSRLNAMVEHLRAGQPRIYYVQGATRLFSLIDLPHFREREESRGRVVKEKRFDSVNEAIQTYVVERLKDDRAGDISAALAKACRTRIRKLSALLLALDQDRRKAERHADHERRAHLLNIHVARLKRGLSRIEVPDVYTVEGSLVSIDLDPELSPQENIAKYFTQAKKLKTSVRKIEDRIRIIDKEKEQLEARLAELTAGSMDEKQRKGLHERFVKEGWIRKDPPRIRKTIADEEELTFREYRVDGGWPVYVGQNERKNDLLTFRFAKKNDLWFHARGVPGSHVVLRRAGRSDNPGKRALEQTASLAAYYSRAKTSSLVPVSYTERKYIRKPKGAPPGQVVMEREDVMIVPPQEPEGGQLQIDNQNDIV